MQNTMTQPQFMTATDFAKEFHVKVATIYSWLHYEQLPKNLYRKLGRKPIFIRDEVFQWFYNGAELKKRPNY